MNVGASIRSIREKNGMKQGELAEKVGVTQSMICQIERGTRPLSVQLGVEIAKVLGCTLNDIVEGA